MLAQTSSRNRNSVIAAPASAAAASTTASTTSAAATATTAFAHGARFIHHQSPAHELLAVAGLDRAIRCAIVGELGESKTAGLAGELVTNDLDGIGVNSRL